MWTISTLDVVRNGRALVVATPSFEVVEGTLIAVHASMLILLILCVFLVGTYSVLFAINLTRQLRARRRAMLKTVAAQFNRDEWIDIVPGLLPGTKLYECMFAEAPQAHHEGDRVRVAISKPVFPPVEGPVDVDNDELRR